MRYRFVDKIVNLEAGKNIHCQYTWPKNLEIFQDHFPGFPVVPGVLLTEMMGQCSALCIESAHTDLTSAMLIQNQECHISAVGKSWCVVGYICRCIV